MVTEFGKILRKERVEREWTLGDMADALQISPAYLSHMEMGRRPVPGNIIQEIARLFGYHEVKAAQLRRAAVNSYSPDVIKIHSKDLMDEDRDLVKMFARRFPDLSAEEKMRMFNILGEKEDDANE